MKTPLHLPPSRTARRPRAAPCRIAFAALAHAPQAPARQRRRQEPGAHAWSSDRPSAAANEHRESRCAIAATDVSDAGEARMAEHAGDPARPTAAEADAELDQAAQPDQR